jgi:hypothetical protein
LRSDTEKRQESVYFKFQTGAMLRGTAKERYEVYQIGRQIGVLSANDVRELEDLNPVEGGDEYSNPAITPGATHEDSEEPQQNIDAREAVSEYRACLAMVENMIGVEANKAKAAAKKGGDFRKWVTGFYETWQGKLSDKLEAIGCDPAAAVDHCAESKKLLAQCAWGISDEEELAQAVGECVANWSARADIIITKMKG